MGHHLRVDVRIRAPRVGVFDSGVGGISILKALRVAAPWLDLTYVADQAHCPYGDRPDHEIVDRAVAIVDFLVDHQADAVVVACNTATVAAVEELRRRYPIPVIGTEPPVKPAAALSTSGTVGVLATSGTLSGRKFARLVEDHANGVRVLTQPCPGLADRVETGDLEGPETRRLLSGFVEPLLEGGADVIVLGFTSIATVLAGTAMIPTFVLPRENSARENVLGTEDVLASVQIPAPRPGTRSTYHKVLDREAWTHAVVSAAIVLEMDQDVCRSARVVLGGVAPIPWRLPEVERLLAGQRMTPDLALKAAEASIVGARPLGKNAYKVPLTKGVVRRTLAGLSGLA